MIMEILQKITEQFNLLTEQQAKENPLDMTKFGKYISEFGEIIKSQVKEFNSADIQSFSNPAEKGINLYDE
jgi:hypothetical protein